MRNQCIFQLAYSLNLRVELSLSVKYLDNEAQMIQILCTPSCFCLKSCDFSSRLDDGWTTAVSRKDKKRKKLGLEESAGSGEECAAVEETVQHVSMAEEPPMEQRTKKSKSKTAKAGATETQKVLQPTTTLVPVTEEPKKEEPEPIVQVGTFNV